jgi:AraC-like DNA-binding protein
VVLCGSYSFGPEGANPLLRGLPDLLHVTAGSGTDLDVAIALLASESTGTFPGSALVIDRMVNALFVLALRSWMTPHANEAGTTWFRALTDPVVGPAVQAIHADPAQTWTVETLASHANLSRAALARRFGDAVGEPPLAYVTRWRMTVAASLLAEGERVASVAQQVGYGNEFAFAKAFKRVRGGAPGTFRVQSRHAMAHQLSR